MTAFNNHQERRRKSVPGTDPFYLQYAHTVSDLSRPITAGCRTLPTKEHGEELFVSQLDISYRTDNNNRAGWVGERREGMLAQRED